jgi:hypothetical protein
MGSIENQIIEYLEGLKGFEALSSEKLSQSEDLYRIIKTISSYIQLKDNKFLLNICKERAFYYKYLSDSSIISKLEAINESIIKIYKLGIQFNGPEKVKLEIQEDKFSIIDSENTIIKEPLDNIQYIIQLFSMPTNYIIGNYDFFAKHLKPLCDLYNYFPLTWNVHKTRENNKITEEQEEQFIQSIEKDFNNYHNNITELFDLLVNYPRVNYIEEFQTFIFWDKKTLNTENALKLLKATQRVLTELKKSYIQKNIINKLPENTDKIKQAEKVQIFKIKELIESKKYSGSTFLFIQDIIDRANIGVRTKNDVEKHKRKSACNLISNFKKEFPSLLGEYDKIGEGYPIL